MKIKNSRPLVISIVVISVLLVVIVSFIAYATLKKSQDAINNSTAISQKENTENENAEKKNAENNSDEMSTEQYTKAASGNYDLVMGLDSWIGGVPVVYGVENGIGKKYSLSIGIEKLTDEKIKMKGLKEGKFQVVEIALPIYLNMQKEYGGSGNIVGITDFSYGADGLISKSEIKDLSELKGKKVAYLSDDLSKYALYKFLNKAGLSQQDIEPIEHSSFENIMEDINNGNADAVIAADDLIFTILEYVNAKNPNAMKLLSTSRDIQEFLPTVLVFNNEFAQKHPQKVTNFLKVWFDSVQNIMISADKSYLDILESTKKYSDIYGDVTEDTVKKALSGIKLMSLKGNFDYFGIENEKDAKFTTIIKETQRIVQNSVSNSKKVEDKSVVSDMFLKSIFAEEKK